MANLKTLLTHHPALADYKFNEMIGFRGDVLAYRPNLESGSFSTDGVGYRYSQFDGQKFGAAEALASARYGVVLGPSSIFGTGLASNAETLPSQLGELIGIPFVNGAMPGGNSRNLYSALAGLVSIARNRPAAVVLSTGGDLVNFCESGIADPIFGSPNHAQNRRAASAGKGQPRDAAAGLAAMLSFNRTWTGMAATLCRALALPLVLVHQSTFFDKPSPSEKERECALGEPRREPIGEVYANVRKASPPFFEQRQRIADRLGVPLAGTDLTGTLEFIDEFHLDAPSTRRLAQSVAEALLPLLDKKPGAKAPRKTPKPA